MRMSDVIYLPQAKWKSGERRAFSTSAAARSGRVVPVFKITPAGSFDPEEQRVLSTTEYLRRFGRQLADSCGRRLAFIDAELIDDERHHRAVGVHPLAELLERARLEGANAAPVYSCSNSKAYLAAVHRFLSRDTNAVACLRLGLHELETIGSAADLIEIANSVGGRPERTVLLLDGGPISISDPEDLAHLVVNHLARLVPKDVWMRVFWSATTLPDKPKLKAGMIGRYPRRDWQVYNEILKSRGDLPHIPMFSDYMLEYPSNYAPIQVAPTAKLSYSDEADYIQVMGISTRHGDKYRNIFQVAARLGTEIGLKEPSYSFGDAYIAMLASGMGRTGNASMWKWCSTDHHLALVHEQLAEALGVPRLAEALTPEAEQLVLV